MVSWHLLPTDDSGRLRRLLWEAMAHVVNHGMQHRSEAAAMLTEIGYSPGDILEETARERRAFVA